MATGGTATKQGTPMPEEAPREAAKAHQHDDVIMALPDEAKPVPGQTRGLHNYTLSKAGFRGRVQAQPET
jgi:hypothetical protein